MVMVLGAGARWKRGVFTTCFRLVPVLCFIGVATAGPAAAVDIVNPGKEARTITVIADGKSRTVTVAGGATVANVCGACTIKADGASREASGDQRVTLAGTLLLVSGKPADAPTPK